MFTVEIISFTVLLIYSGLFIIFAILTGKPLKAISMNAISGSFVLILLCLVKDFLSLNISFNIYTLAVSVILGIPGVILQILIQMIF